jgi:hypothetical protein
LVTVFESDDSSEVLLAKSLLEAADILYYAKGEAVQDLIGGRLWSGRNLAIGPVALQVPSDVAAKASQLLESHAPATEYAEELDEHTRRSAAGRAPSTLSDEVGSARRRQRPSGVAVLSIILFANSLAILVLAMVSLDRLGGSGSTMRSIGVRPSVLLTTAALFSVLSMASSIGLWRGAIWGWHLGSFYLLWEVLKNIVALTSIASIVSARPLAADSIADPGTSFARHALKALAALLYSLYFHGGNVREYFGVGSENLARSVVLGILICAGLTILASWVQGL